MNDQEKKDYLERYHQQKEKGVPFFPDIIFKDALISLVVFLILVALAYFVGAPLEARANPADTTYTPRPEWYFLFLFQLLKYFPGSLEVIGVVAIPTLVILLLFFLPLIDRSYKRNFLSRPVVTGITAFALVGVIFLTVQARLETPPPEAEFQGDQTAALYAKNCAGCHGPTIAVAKDVNLHDVIAQGRHTGMPAWSGDLTSDQIDALAGFILSPGGSQLFTDNCSACHQVSDLVAGNPLELKNALEQGPNYAQHKDVNVPDWTKTLDEAKRTTLLNFLVAPDGQRLFAINCATCHGRSVAYSGNESELRTIISQGGLHLQMPPWREKLSQAELETLARYVVDPNAVPEGQQLFHQYCSSCHGERVPASQDYNQALETISKGGAHETMPVWGSILTADQIDALVSYTINAAEGISTDLGQQLFAKNCSPCHGEFGEGGVNPTRPGDIIAPISSAEFLKTRDDYTLRSIIAQGQPNFGMSPFSTTNGGALDDTEIDAIVAYIRTWEANPPVELPPEIATTQLSLTGPDLYKEVCAQCHGPKGEGGLGPSLADPNFQSASTDQKIFDTINNGHNATAMIAWGEILSSDQIGQLVQFIRQLGETAPPPAAATAPTFVADVKPILDAKCRVCHGSMGGWDATSYQSVMTTGDNGPVVVAGKPDQSLLAQKLQGTQTQGGVMPPGGKLPASEIKVILDWIAAGASEK
jgi:mono/diheme cytochrome c family protein